jgi:uncharacterized protein YecE (DUF72 family)
VGAEVRIGTSGWEYRDWRGDFYPASLPRDRWLKFYAERFETVELNNPFYRLPDAATFVTWGKRVPPLFRYAVKASRYLTHVRRLRDPSEPVERFWSRAMRLGPRLGPVLYQLPPRWRPDLERLGHFLDLVPAAAQAIEFRDRRYAPRDGAGHGACIVVLDIERGPMPEETREALRLRTIVVSGRAALAKTPPEARRLVEGRIDALLAELEESVRRAGGDPAILAAIAEHRRRPDG